MNRRADVPLRAALVVVAMATIAACRGKDTTSRGAIINQQALDAARAESAAVAGGGERDTTRRGTLTAPSNAPPRLVAFTVNEGGFSSPDSILNGPMEIRLTNNGRFIHEARLLRLPDDVTVAQAMGFLAQRGILPPTLRPMGGVGPVKPGASATVIQPVRDGIYLVVCTLPDSEGNAWFTKGVIGSIRITGRSPINLQPANMRAASSISTSNNAWRFSTALTRGQNRTLALEGRARSTAIPQGETLLMLEHFGAIGHDAVLIRATGPRAMKDYVSWLLGDTQQMPDVITGIPGLVNGVRAYIRLNLTPGAYIIFCPTLRGGGENTRGFEVGEYDQFVVK